jgi:23S rRNA pseudouridine2605 synthase
LIIRLNKFLATAGIASRRKCDDIILAGRVKVNGKIITQLGTRIDDSTDTVICDDKEIRLKSEFIYIILNKPKGVITTAEDQFQRRTVLDLLPIDTRLFPVGRLDADSTGLLLLTNDGNLSNSLVHPRFKVKKVYHVLLNKRIKPLALYKIEHGIMLEDKMTQPCNAKEIRVVDNCSLLEIIISEGRNRQIRKMLAILGYDVEELDRISFGPLTLSGLRRGEWRFLNASEITRVKKISSIESKNDYS